MNVTVIKISLLSYMRDTILRNELMTIFILLTRRKKKKVKKRVKRKKRNLSKPRLCLHRGSV